MSDLTILRDLSDLGGTSGEIRAGGTDLHDRLRSGVSRGPVVDIAALPGLSAIEAAPEGGLRLGALLSLTDLAASVDVAAAHAGVTRTAGALATPQIRNAATLGGALLQHTRCAYYRTPGLTCTKKGDAACGGREGVHANGVLFDRGGCAHPHAASLGMALLAYGARVETTARSLTIEELYGDGSDPTRDHLLDPGEVLTHVTLPPLAPGERSAYFRATARAEAEWPTVECLVRLRIEGGEIAAATVAAGAVSQVPLLLPRVSAALIGRSPDTRTLEGAASLAADGANPLPQAAWKTRVLTGTVLTALEVAIS